MSLSSGGLLLVGEAENKLPIGTAMSQRGDRLKQRIPTPATNSLPGQTPWRDSPHRGRRKIPERTQQQLFIRRGLAPTSLVGCVVRKTWRGCGSLKLPMDLLQKTEPVHTLHSHANEWTSAPSFPRNTFGQHSYWVRSRSPNMAPSWMEAVNHLPNKTSPVRLFWNHLLGFLLLFFLFPFLSFFFFNWSRIEWV